MRTIKLEALRKQIGVVLQDVFLFSGSVLDNITLRNPAISREQVIAAAKLIDMHDFIMQLPGGYDYNVMERGGSLSLGAAPAVIIYQGFIIQSFHTNIR